MGSLGRWTFVMGCLFQAKTVSQLSQNDYNLHSRKEESIRNSLHFCLCPPISLLNMAAYTCLIRGTAGPAGCLVPAECRLAFSLHHQLCLLSGACCRPNVRPLPGACLAQVFCSRVSRSQRTAPPDNVRLISPPFPAIQILEKPQF